MHETGCSGLVHWDDPEGWEGGRWEGGSGWGTHVHPWWIHVKFFLIKKKKSQSLPISFLNCSEKYNGKTQVDFKENQYRK